MNSAGHEAVPVDGLSDPVRALFAALQHADTASGDAGTEVPGNLTVYAGEAGREALGTRVRWRLWLRHGRPVRARYRAYGCPHTLAACEWIARQLEATVAHTNDPRRWLQGLGTPAQWALTLQIPAARLGRLLVVEDALRAALPAEVGVTKPE